LDPVALAVSVMLAPFGIVGAEVLRLELLEADELAVIVGFAIRLRVTTLV
jgi:hypothetical protein